MNALKNLLTVVATLAAFAAAAKVQAESLAHLDAQAVEVESRTRDMCWEMARFHRGQLGYGATYRQAWEMWSVSSHVHELLHNAANLGRVQRNTADLRDLLVGIRLDVARWDAAGVFCTFDLKRKLAGLEEAVEHLASDVGVSRPNVTSPMVPGAPPAPPSPPAPPVPAPSAQPPIDAPTGSVSRNPGPPAPR